MDEDKHGSYVDGDYLPWRGQSVVTTKVPSTKTSVIMITTIKITIRIMVTRKNGDYQNGKDKAFGTLT